MDASLPVDLVPAWERFFSACLHRRISDRGLCEAVFDDPVLFPLQRQAEMAKMVAIAREARHDVIMEIGADKAGSLLQWCLLGPKRVIACEIRGVPYAEAFERAFPEIDFYWIAESSYSPVIVRQVHDWLTMADENRIDVLFIDGDKSHFDTDFDAYLPLVAPGGVVLFHDITDPAPGRAYRSVCERGFIHEEIVDIADSITAMKLERDATPPHSAHEGWLRHWKGASCGVGVIRLLGDRGGER